MKNAQHTPGPWYYSHEQGNGEGNYKNSLRRWRIDSEDRALMFTAEAWNTHPRDREAWCEVEANVRLAATAPELLAALKTLTDHAQEAYPHFEDARGQADIRAALDAIAKAERRD